MSFTESVPKFDMVSVLGREDPVRESPDLCYGARLTQQTIGSQLVK